MCKKHCHGCFHYGSQFENREEHKEDSPLRFAPLYMRMRHRGRR